MDSSVDSLQQKHDSLNLILRMHIKLDRCGGTFV